MLGPPTTPAIPGRRGGGGTGRYQRGAPLAAPARPRYQPRATAAPAARNSTGGPGGRAPGGGHREGLGATSCPRPRRRHKGGCVRRTRTKGALTDGALGGAELGPLPSGSLRPPRCPRAPPDVPKMSPSLAVSPLSPEPAGGTRGVAGGTWSRGHSEGSPVCAPHSRAPPPGTAGVFGVTPAPPARPALGVFPLGIGKTTPGRPRPFRGARGAAGPRGPGREPSGGPP